jgi:UDP-N-acetylmuramate dehydrogenase
MSALRIEDNVPLAPHTTLKVGGRARFFASAKIDDEVLEALDFARKRGCPLFVMGGGSNIVVSDSGFPGLVLKIDLRGFRSPDAENPAIISAAAGENWDAFVQSCVDRGLAGIECLSGIPGTVGGAPVQNIGAYGQEAGEAIVSVRALDRESGRIVLLTRAGCGFAYRSSIFNTARRDRYVVLETAFELKPGGLPCILYPDLQDRFRRDGREPSLPEVRDAVLEIRKSKGMFLCESDPDARSVGSFFKNPRVSPDEAARAENTARGCGRLQPSESIPRLPSPEGTAKLPAAWLVERAGFHRGFAYGNAGISGKHSLAIVNRGGARAQEIMDLARLIQKRVRECFGLELEMEPVFVGDFNRT